MDETIRIRLIDGNRARNKRCYMDLNKMEKDKLYLWSCEKQESLQEEKSTKKDSYYNKRCESDYLTEYNIENVKDITRVVEELCRINSTYEDIKKVLTIAMLKNKQIDEKNENVNKQDVLPTFIYNF